jgi:hypothetical protein
MYVFPFLYSNFINICEQVNSPNIIRMIKLRKMRWGGHVALMGEKRLACMILVRAPGRNRPLGRSRRMWEDNIEMNLREIVLTGM